ncbi:OmpA family protein [Lewinella sp. IMCC34183]|uniref:OmpA family protein n=1 Tax=Lewinella sp. IMCC34183 TaxID=2248762 RepID=UPI0018E5542F|nr:OmpA family protein [Lewinella sp. IMCC34183]
MLLCLCGALAAQGTPLPDTDDPEVTTTVGLTSEAPTNKRDQPSMLEIGITPYYSWLSSDVTSKAGYGGGIHLRKSLDHLFSLRVDGMFARSRGDNESGDNSNNRRFESNWVSGTAYGVITMNNFTFKGDIRDVNLFLMAGAGGNWFATEYQRPNTPFEENRNGEIDQEFRTHFSFGVGFTYRVSPRFNIGVEYQTFVPLGNRADLLDGYAVGNFRDVQNVGGISFNFNLGNPETHTEPRYWTNAFTPVKEDIATLNRRVDEATTDSDGDGIPDNMDQEPNTPAEATVDSRGRTLDSDGDGVPDYRDQEPFFPPRETERVDENGVVMERIDAPLSESEVQGMIDNSMNDAMEQINNNNRTRINMEGGAIYLPMITFPLNGAEVTYDDYGVLASIARVMQANPGMTLIVRGYTDQTGDPDYNQRLSYRRALNVINLLVDNNGIARDRLILQYRGEDEAIVPRDLSKVNRRVEFLTGIPNATEDPAPEGVDTDGGN